MVFRTFLNIWLSRAPPKDQRVKLQKNLKELVDASTLTPQKKKTVYYAKVLKKHAEFAVEFLADILQNSTFDETELEKERGVILQEIAMTNDTPDDIVFDYFQEAAYPDQALGRSILGPVKNIKKFGREHFVNYIGKQYNCENICVVAAGNIKESDLVKWSKKYFNQLGSNKIKAPQSGKYSGGDFRKEKN